MKDIKPVAWVVKSEFLLDRVFTDYGIACELQKKRQSATIVPAYALPEGHVIVPVGYETSNATSETPATEQLNQCCQTLCDASIVRSELDQLRSERDSLLELTDNQQKIMNAQQRRIGELVASNDR